VTNFYGLELYYRLGMSTEIEFSYRRI